VPELPHNDRAEVYLLSALLTYPERAAALLPMLAAEDFYEERHQELYRAMVAAQAAGHTIEEPALRQVMHPDAWDRIGGLALLAEIELERGGGDRPEAYVAMIRDRSGLRRLYDLGTQAQRAVEARECGAAELAQRFAARCEEIRRGVAGVSVTSGYRRGAEIIAEVRARRAGERAPRGISSGLPRLDAMVSLGFGESWVLAGRTGTGKSSLALQILSHNLDRGVVCGLVSLEMKRELIVARLVSHRARLNLSRVIADHLDSDQCEARDHEEAALEALPWHLDDEGGQTAAEVVARARRLHREHGARLLVVDYVGRLRLDGNARRRDDAQLGDIGAQLADLAKELDAVVLIVAQLNRDSEKERREPQLSDLADSDALARDPHGVILLHRERAGGVLSDNGALIVGKNRNGPIGRIPTVYHGDIQTLLEITRQRAAEGE
jgi:replicative DNA helicase